MSSPHRLRKSAARQAVRQATRERIAIMDAIRASDSTTSMAMAWHEAAERATALDASHEAIQRPTGSVPRTESDWR